MPGWRGRGGRPLDRSRARRRRRDGVGWGRRSMHSFGCWCWPRKTRVRRNSRGWRGSRTSTQGSQKGHRHPPRGRQSRGHQKGPNTDKHTNNPRTPESANRRGRSPPATKVAGDYWRLGETAHLPEVSLFERFLSRARGVRPNRSTRTRRGLARRGGPTYSVVESFRDFWGSPIADLHYTHS